MRRKRKEDHFIKKTSQDTPAVPILPQKRWRRRRPPFPLPPSCHMAFQRLGERGGRGGRGRCPWIFFSLDNFSPPPPPPRPPCERTNRRNFNNLFYHHLQHVSSIVERSRRRSNSFFPRFTWQIPVPIYRRTVSGSFLPPSLHPTRPPPLPSSGTTFRPSGLPTTLLRRRGGRSVSFPPLHNICSGGTEDPRENWRSRVCVCLTGCMAARASRSMCWEFVASPRRQNGGSMWPGGNMDWREEYHCDVRGQSLGEIFK